MVTRNGIIKRTKLSDFEYQRRGGKIAVTLDEGDELIFVRHTLGNDELIIASRDGNATRFEESGVRPTGRTSRGVKAMTLEDDDIIVGVALVDDTKSLLTITENGMGKRTPFDDFRLMKHRGGKGVVCHKISDKSGKLCSAITVSENDDVMIITADGVIIRTPVSGINLYSRTAGGVIVMRVKEGNSIINFTRLEKEEDIEKAESEINNLDPNMFTDEESEVVEKPEKVSEEETTAQENNENE
jgi:DNA gyrase subunit A